MARRFPADLHCRLDLARLLAESGSPADQVQAQRLLRQVLQLAPNDLHAHSTLAQLAIRRQDWPQALAHAQQGLRIDPGDEACAVLLATAYARRNGPDDLPTAITDLQRFVRRYPGNLNAEGYLGDLLRRQKLAAQGQRASFEEDEEKPARPDSLPPETDAAWCVFAETIHAWVAAAVSGGVPLEGGWEDRVLPLPQALRQAVARGRWDADVLDAYDPAAQREFPLEIRLWRYLQTLQSGAAGESERERAKQAVQAWLDAETRSPAQDNPSWWLYLDKHWQALNAPADAALPEGAEWLKDLLDRYQPLPAPLSA